VQGSAEEIAAGEELALLRATDFSKPHEEIQRLPAILAGPMELLESLERVAFFQSFSET
jgi:hypothetical protein